MGSELQPPTGRNTFQTTPCVLLLCDRTVLEQKGFVLVIDRYISARLINWPILADNHTVWLIIRSSSARFLFSEIYSQPC